MTEAKLRDSWTTPFSFMAALCRKVTPTYAPYIDVCATEENSRLPYYYDEEQDALSLDWTGSANDAGIPPIFWCNPGYSNVAPWVEAAIEAAETGGLVYLLTHDNYNSAWFRLAYASSYCHSILLLQPRIRFIPAGSIKESSPRGNNMLMTFAHRRYADAPTIMPMNWEKW